MPRKEGASRAKRKVLIIVENLPVPTDRRVWGECRALRAAGYEVSVICPTGTRNDSEKRATIEGVEIYRYRSPQSDGGFASYLVEYGIALIMSFVLMCRILATRGFDVVQLCNPPDLLILAAAPFKLLGKKIIFDQHDLCPEIYSAQKGGLDDKHLVMRMLYLFERLTYRLSNVVIVVNDSCKDVAVGRGRRKADGVFVVRNAPSLAEVRSVEPDDALKRGKRYLLAYAGMMGPQDGIDVMLDVIRRLKDQSPAVDFHVRIMGEGTVLDEMRRRAAELDLLDIVEFTGRVTHDDVLRGIATADVCLCPDHKTPLSDKCSLVKAVEYMSVGRPFVAFDLNEVRRFSNGAALFASANDEAEFADKVRALLGDEEKRLQMGESGRRAFETHLAWDHSIRNLLDAYEAALSDGGRSRDVECAAG